VRLKSVQQTQPGPSHTQLLTGALPCFAAPFSLPLTASPKSQLSNSEIQNLSYKTKFDVKTRFFWHYFLFESNAQFLDIIILKLRHHVFLHWYILGIDIYHTTTSLVYDYKKSAEKFQLCTAKNFFMIQKFILIYFFNLQDIRMKVEKKFSIM